MFRFILLLFAIVPFCSAQNFPAFRWIQEVDGSGLDQFTGMGTDAAGNIYIAGTTGSPNFPVKNAVQSHLAAMPGPGLISSDCFVTKLDPAGNVVYSTYFGGTGVDAASAMTVDSAGNVYVAGTTTSTDFPTTKGTYQATYPTPPATNGTETFLFKLNPDGSVGYSTYFALGPLIQAIATGPDGSAYLAGTSYGGLPTTPGAYLPTFCCAPTSNGFFLVIEGEGFLTRFDPAGARLVFSTYVGFSQLAGSSPNATANAVAVAPDGSAYVGSAARGVLRLDATGSSLLASNTALPPQSMVLAPDGSLYLAGVFPLQATAGAFQSAPNPIPNLAGGGIPHGGVVRVDAQLQRILAGTYFDGANGFNTISSLALDAAGNLFIGGQTSSGLPTRTPIQQGFGAGFVSELSGDLTSLLFSSYFGANHGGQCRDWSEWQRPARRPGSIRQYHSCACKHLGQQPRTYRTACFADRLHRECGEPARRTGFSR
jgi:Beta-propeller repeat